MPFDGNSWSANRLVPQVGGENFEKKMGIPSFSLICTDWKKGMEKLLYRKKIDSGEFLAYFGKYLF